MLSLRSSNQFYLESEVVIQLESFPLLKKAIAEAGEVDSGKDNQGAEYLKRTDPFSEKNISNQNRKNDVDVSVYSSLAVPDPFHGRIPDDIGDGDGKDTGIEKGSPALKGHFAPGNPHDIPSGKRNEKHRPKGQR